jgi:hypothetical protein
MAGDVCRPGGQWCAVGGAPVRRIGATWRHPLATDVTGESTPAQRSDRRSLRRLGVCAQRGYGAYGGAPMWPRATSRAERAPAFQGKFSLLNRFSNAIFFKF